MGTGRTALTVLLCLSLAGPALSRAAAEPADPRSAKALELLNQGIAAYQAGQYEPAARFYVLSIQQRPYVRATANLCNLYLYGQGVPRNPRAAFRLCSAAAEQNDPHALTMLGDMYLRGVAVSRDVNQAEQLFLRAARAGHVHAQYVAGQILARSADPARRDEGLDWLRRAHGNGHADAGRLLTESAP